MSAGKGQPQRSSCFHTYEEMKNAPPVRFLIRDFLQAQCLNMFAGLPGHTKTFVMIAIAKSLLSGEKLFDHFEVVERAQRVLYLVPEIAVGSAYLRFCKIFKLDEYIKDGRLLISTLSIGRKITLAEPEVLEKCNGADVFLDTLPRFRRVGAKESDADGNTELADQLFNLQMCGARSVIPAQHSPKEFINAKEMTLENVVRGSGDITAVPATVWGLRRVTDPDDQTRNLVYVQNVKPRDFVPSPAFLLRLRPDLDLRGVIGMEKSPGTCGSMWDEIEVAATKTVSKKSWAYEAWKKDPTLGREALNKIVKEKFGSGAKTEHLGQWLREWSGEQDLPYGVV
jgi:hypothetical protein